MKIYKNFGEFLQNKRIERQITLREMAKDLGCSAPFLSDVEKDRRNPFELAKLDRIAGLLNLSEEDKSVMMNLAGEKRNSVAPDLPEYIRNEYVSAALRTAKKLDASEEEWNKFIKELKNRRG
jgi:transcriptional regulator with XRE-family HTH domain